MLDNSGHYECEDIMAMLSEMGLKVSRATVYRTLDILVKYDFARKLVLDDGVAKYENKVDSSHHDHMICLETGAVNEFTDDLIEQRQKDIAAKFEADPKSKGDAQAKAAGKGKKGVQDPYAGSPMVI